MPTWWSPALSTTNLAAALASEAPLLRPVAAYPMRKDLDAELANMPSAGFSGQLMASWASHKTAWSMLLRTLLPGTRCYGKAGKVLTSL